MLLRFIFENDIRPGFCFDVIESTTFGELKSRVANEINFYEECFDLASNGEILDLNQAVQESELLSESEILIIENRDRGFFVWTALKKSFPELGEVENGSDEANKIIFYKALSHKNELLIEYISIYGKYHRELANLLCLALEKRDHYLIDMILDERFEVDLGKSCRCDEQKYFTPFTYAIYMNDFQSTRKILRYKNGKYSNFFEYDIGLKYAAKNDNIKISRLFIDKLDLIGDSFESRNFLEEIFDDIVEYNHFDRFKFLLRLGSDPYRALTALKDNIDMIDDASEYFAELFRYGCMEECLQMFMKIQDPSKLENWFK